MLGHVAARVGVVVVVALAGAFVAGSAGHGAARQTATPEPFPRLVDAGGIQLYAYCRGSGSPTVVLESGLGAPWSTWVPVMAPVARETRVCAYDRAGIGNSDDPPYTPRTTLDQVEDLHELLLALGVDGTIVYVGWSLGGFNARVYFAHYPEQVTGVVLVDASHPDQVERFLAVIPADFEVPVGQGTRLLRDLIAAEVAGDNPERLDLAASAEQVRTVTTLGPVPLVVLSHGIPEPNSGLPPDVAAVYEQVWQAMQLELVALSSNSEQIIAERSGHCIHCSAPGLVVAAILRVVTLARSAL